MRFRREFDMQNETSKTKTPRKPKIYHSLITFGILIVVMAVAIIVYVVDVHVPMFIGVIAAACMALYLGYQWDVIEKAMMDGVYNALQAIIILAIVGVLIGVWIVGGIVPSMIYYGLKLLSPSVFLVAALLICSITSLATGTAWGTMGTMGLALIGIAVGLGIPAPMAAGAIISGAYFGDKVSPLSDTTVLASSSSGTDLFTHIRYMMFTTVPSISVALVVFLVASLMHNPDAVPSTAEYSDALRSTFRISPLLLIVPIFTFFLIIKKVPAILTLMVSAFVAGLAALLFQPGIVASIGGSDVISTGACIKGMMMSWFAGTSVDTGSELVNTLTATRGMGGMLNTVFLIICAVTFGAAMTGSGMFQGITEALTRHIRRRVPSVAATVTTGIVSNVITADQYLSIILSASLFKDLYRKNSLESRLLSRSVEDSATVCSVLIPWNSCGMTQATVLGVATVVYFPYCIFNIVSPLMSILVAAIGSRKKPQVSKSV